MFVIVMRFGLKECSRCALNIMQFINNLGPGHMLKVNCTSNRNEIKGIQEIIYKGFYNFEVNERGKKENSRESIFMNYGEHIEEATWLDVVRNVNLLLKLIAFS
uniref:Uncharacterized protein n=1 Tax=Brassica oleracea TaxID=3712 RepID=A0A3P6CNU6_BRAOL|nr:unnamed protein product [Brassica oleracea]